MRSFDNILIPTDGSEESEEAFDYALPIAKKFNATIHVLHVVYSDIFYLKEQVNLSETLREEINEEIEKESMDVYEHVMDSISDKAKEEDLETVLKRLEGVPYKKINEYVEKHGIDLVVMTTHGKGGLERMMLGSTADKVIRSSKVPVMTVKIREK